MTSPSPTVEAKAKVPATLSSSINPGAMSPIQKSTKIKLQLKNKQPALPTLSEDPSISTSSSETMSPIQKSTKIKLQLKNKQPALPALSEDPPISTSSSSGTISPIQKSTKIKLQLKNKQPALPALSEDTPIITSSSSGTISPIQKSTKIKLQLKNKQPVLPALSEDPPISASSSGTMSSTERSTEVENLLKKTASPRPFTSPPETQRVHDQPSLESSSKPTSSSSDLASSTINASPLPIAVDPEPIRSRSGRVLRQTEKAKQGNPGNNAVAQNAVANIAGQKRKATKAATSSKKRVKFADTDNHESAETTRSHSATVAQRTRIGIGTRFPPLRSKDRVQAVLEASREAQRRAQMLVWQEEREAENRKLRTKMGNALQAWEALERQRELEAQQANIGAF
ncbi:hypothetical protein EAE99_004127 [Botrytis elliptica]|nr:hypothetical protein EAE99_004127 [Botrytis elliptica]